MGGGKLYHRQKVTVISMAFLISHWLAVMFLVVWWLWGCFILGYASKEPVAQAGELVAVIFLSWFWPCWMVMAFGYTLRVEGEERREKENLHAGRRGL